MCQYLEDLRNSVNKYFLNGQCTILQNHSWVKDPFTMQVFFFLRFYLFIHERLKRHRQRHRQREKQAPFREPDVGLDPRTPGSHPEPKTDAQPLSYPGTPRRLEF